MAGSCNVCCACLFSSRLRRPLGYLVQEQGESARQDVLDPIPLQGIASLREWR